MPLTIFLEFALFAAGIAVYVTATRAKDPIGNLALWSLLVALAVLYLASRIWATAAMHGPAAYSALGIWLTVPGSCMGRPASAIKAGAIGNAVTLMRDSSGFMGTAGPLGHPISIVK